MLTRMFGLAAGAIGLALAWPIAAAEPQIHKGTVMSASAGKLVMKDMAGKELSFMVDAMTRITVHGKPGKLEDLQETMPVQVATEANGKVLSVSTIDKEKRNARHAAFASRRAAGFAAEQARLAPRRMEVEVVVE
jgi:hypothetical protein